MTRRIIRTPDDMRSWCEYLSSLKSSYPLTVSWTKGADRSLDQNALAFKWFQEIATQRGDMTVSDVRAHCKLYHGVRMLHAENADFRDQWNRLIRDRFSYEEKLEFMLPPHDYPVTRLMNTKQMTRWLDAIYDEFTAQGIRLTLPDV